MFDTTSAGPRCPKHPFLQEIMGFLCKEALIQVGQQFYTIG